MPPRRDNQNNAQNPELAAMIAQQMAAIIPTLVAQLNQANAGNNNNINVNAPAPCSFKQFNSCNPIKYSGSEGATGLLQWFEGIESTFRHCQCPNNRKVEFASSVFQKRALTWWNRVMRDRGANVAMALTWEELRDLMRREFCPRNEMRALETEFYELTQDSGENRAYTNRYEELSLLCPTMVGPLDRAIEKYIEGLPSLIQDVVTGSKPATVREAIELAATLTDSHVKKGNLFRTGGRKERAKVTTETAKDVKIGASSSSSSKKRKASKNYAVVAPTQVNQAAPQPNKRQYVGGSPLCNRCSYHHLARVPCKQCTSCGRLGHLATTCRIVPPQNQVVAAPPPAQNVAPPRYPIGTCFNCGDPNHFKRECRKLANAQPARGRAFNINANEARAINDVVNGTFLVNDHYASVLFDTGADKSFVSLKFEPLLAMPRTKLGKPFTVEVANGNPFVLDSVICMDWLAKHHAEVVCFDKFIRIPLPSSDILEIYGEKPSNGLKLMTCTEAQKYLRKKYVAFLAHVVEKKDESKSIQDIPIIRDFPEVFPEDLPGLPPPRQVEFRIDLVPGANTIAKSPYRLAPSEMQELASQLQELSDKGFIRPSFSP
ncbi:uncharacterized protein LOC110891531 [Helianthus annuus]|uniref:uncharacterized protein LOC110891531 n=1 Tax=Helianthus annuus TaxID=4232 RepID=UPI000B903959|nr:uncharacterized protein LOC110891531 [Helianthus annuus]